MTHPQQPRAAAWEAKVEPLLMAGRLEEAAALLDSHLRRHPRDVAALRQQARIRLGQGQAAEAVRRLEAAARLAATQPDIHYELGVAHLGANDPAAAIRAFRRELAGQPGHLDCMFNLAWALRRQGSTAEAADLLVRAVAGRPAWPAAWFNLGNALTELDRCAEAVDAYHQALAQARPSPDLLANLGQALWRSGDPDAAEERLRQALALQDQHPEAVVALSTLLSATGRAEEAEALCRVAIGRHAGHPRLLLALGRVLTTRRRRDEAAEVLALATRADPGSAEAWNEWGGTLLALQRLDEAEAAFTRALELCPDLAEAVNNLGNLASLRGDAPVALDHYRRAHALAPDNAAIHSNMLFLLAHGGLQDLPATVEEHRRFGLIHERAAPMTPPPRGPRERLRIGYVSPDFCDHAVALWFEGTLAAHDRAAFDIHCYHCGPRSDDVTARLMGYGDTWRFIAGMPADAAAALIRADDIDILIDLAGHSANNALPVFARKPARIQAAFLGYPFTTGLTRIDYRLTDFIGDPPGMNDANYTETLARIVPAPTMRLPEDAPDPGPLPMLSGAGPRLGSFNKPQKITDEVLDVWARVLAEIPAATLMMVVPGGDEAPVRARYRGEFARRGIAPERIETEPTCGLRDFLRLVARVDVALDPFPYGGGTTSALTLWMGVPMVCVRGYGAAGGVSAGMLGVVGLSHLWARDGEDYVRVARDLVSDAAGLAEIRAGLRDRLRQSNLTKEREFAAAVEDEFRRWWDLYQENDRCAG